jgi:hypothetical protein
MAKSGIGPGWPNDGPQGKELAEIERGITKTMRDLVDDLHRPKAPKEVEAPVVKGTGWLPEQPLKSPMASSAMQMLDQHMEEVAKQEKIAALEERCRRLQAEIDKLERE